MPCVSQTRQKLQLSNHYNAKTGYSQNTMKPEEDHSEQTKQYDLKVPVLLFIKKKKKCKQTG